MSSTLDLCSDRLDAQICDTTSDALNLLLGIYGKMMLVNGDVKRNLGGKTELVKSCKTENERVAALKEYFDIVLTQEEIEGIRGRVTDLGIETVTA